MEMLLAHYTWSRLVLPRLLDYQNVIILTYKVLEEKEKNLMYQNVGLLSHHSTHRRVYIKRKLMNHGCALEYQTIMPRMHEVYQSPAKDAVRHP